MMMMMMLMLMMMMMMMRRRRMVVVMMSAAIAPMTMMAIMTTKGMTSMSTLSMAASTMTILSTKSCRTRPATSQTTGGALPALLIPSAWLRGTRRKRRRSSPRSGPAGTCSRSKRLEVSPLRECHLRLCHMTRARTMAASASPSPRARARARAKARASPRRRAARARASGHRQRPATAGHRRLLAGRVVAASPTLRCSRAGWP